MIQREPSCVSGAMRRIFIGLLAAAPLFAFTPFFWRAVTFGLIPY